MGCIYLIDDEEEFILLLKRSEELMVIGMSRIYLSVDSEII
jgi:hypothetical protein